MGFVGMVLLAGAVVTLVAWVYRRFVPRRQSGDAGQQRPNVLLWFVGSATALVGLIMLVAGALGVASVEDTFRGTGPQDTADAASLATWGAVLLVNGVYVWRGARRRGLRDRLGRLLIIVGYLVLAIAMSRSIHMSTELWATSTAEAGSDVLNRTMVEFLGWGVPASLLVWVGTRTASERILLTAQASAHHG